MITATHAAKQPL